MDVEKARLLANKIAAATVVMYGPFRSTDLDHIKWSAFKAAHIILAREGVPSDELYRLSEFQSYAPFDPTTGQPCENCGHPFQAHTDYRCPTTAHTSLTQDLLRAAACAINPGRRRTLRRLIRDLVVGRTTP